MAEKSHPPDKNSKDSGHLVNNGSELSESAGEGHSLGVASGVGGGYSSALGNGSSVGVEEFDLAEHPTEWDEACLAIGSAHSSLHEKGTKPSAHPNTGTASYPGIPLLQPAEELSGVCAPFSNFSSGDMLLPMYANSTACEEQASASSDSSMPVDEDEIFSAAVRERRFSQHKSKIVGNTGATRSKQVEAFKRMLEDKDQTTIIRDLETNFRKSEREVFKLKDELLVSQQQHATLVRRIEELKVAIKAMNENYRLCVARLEEKYGTEMKGLEDKLKNAKTEEEKQVIEVAIWEKRCEKERHLRCLAEECHKAEHEATMALWTSKSP